jgi:hypothetical protein
VVIQEECRMGRNKKEVWRMIHIISARNQRGRGKDEKDEI